MYTILPKAEAKLRDRKFCFLNSKLRDKQFHSIFSLVYFFSILLSSQTRLLTPGHTNPNQTKAIEAKRTEAATRIEPKTCAALSIISGALSTELSKSRGDQVQNGAYKPMLVARLSRNFEFRKPKLPSLNLSHCLYHNFEPLR